jgi:CBS domain-containing protein
MTTLDDQSVGVILKLKNLTVEKVCTHKVVTIEHDRPIAQCAKIMHDAQIGCLVITEVRDGLCFPVGILTDRDIAVKVVAFSLDPNIFTAFDVMTQPLVTARQEEELILALNRMRSSGVKRVPVISEDGSLVGILTTDDIWETLLKDDSTIECIQLASSTKMKTSYPPISNFISLVKIDIEKHIY